MSSRDNAIAAVDAYAVDLANQATVTVESTLQPQIDSLTSQLATATRTVTADAATIAELHAQPAARATSFSADPDINAGKYQAVSAELGAPLAHVRCFDSTRGILTAWAQCKNGLPLTAPQPVLSFKRWVPSEFQTFLSAVDRDVWVAYFHEPEGDAAKKGNAAAAPAAYLAAYAAMQTARTGHPNGHRVKLVKILTSYRQDGMYPFGPNTAWQAYHGWTRTGTSWTGRGQTFIDAYGWDVYGDTATQAVPAGVIPTAQKLLGPLKAMHDSILATDKVNIPWCVPELGIGIPANGKVTDDKMLAFVTDAITYCKSNGALWVNWWWTPKQPAEVMAHPLTPLPKSLAAWAAAVKAS